MEIYIPNAIREIAKTMPEKVGDFYQKYPYEIYGHPEIKRKLKQAGITDHQMEYQECYAAASDAYLYSIHRCALCGYSHVEFYIKKMIAIAIIWGIVIANENKYLCRFNNLKEINLNAYERSDRW